MKTTDNQNELFIVVDESDNIIDYRTRADCHNDKTLIHRAIGVLVYNSLGELLLQKRSLTKDTYPGFWAISIGGHVTQGQTYEQTAKREMKEELGISAPLEKIGKWLYRLPNETEYGVLYKSINDGPFRLEPKEVDTVKFFHPDQISELVKSQKLQISECTNQTLKKVGIL
jgi:isopentenyl-diphosphate delta-isomerase type 1